MPSLPGITTSDNIRSKGCDFKQFERAVRIVADRSLMPGHAEGARERGKGVGVVIDDQ